MEHVFVSFFQANPALSLDFHAFRFDFLLFFFFFPRDAAEAQLRGCHSTRGVLFVASYIRKAS